MLPLLLLVLLLLLLALLLPPLLLQADAAQVATVNLRLCRRDDTAGAVDRGRRGAIIAADARHNTPVPPAAIRGGNDLPDAKRGATARLVSLFIFGCRGV